MTADLSGGVFTPAAFVSSKSARLPSVVYTSHFFASSKLSVLDTDCFEFAQVSAAVKEEALPGQASGAALSSDGRANAAIPDDASSDSGDGAQSADGEARTRFNPFEYTFRGIFVPIGLVPLYNDIFEIRDAAFLGLTWHSKGYHISAGYEPFTNIAGVHLVLFGQTDNNNFSYQLWGTAAFDKDGFRQTYDELTLKAMFPVLNHSYLIFQNKEQFFYGHPNNFPWMSDAASSLVTTMRFSSLTTGVLSTVRKTGLGYHEKGGFYGGLLASYNYVSTTEKNKSGYGLNLGVKAGFSVPNILPFENPKDYTFNLPLDVDVMIFPDIARFMSCSANMILFSHEVQKGTKNAFIPLYLNRFYVTASYESHLYYSEYYNMAVNTLLGGDAQSLFAGCKYADRAGLGFVLDLTVNTGSFFQQTLGALKLSCDVLLDINQKDPGTGRIHLKVLSQLVF